MTEEIKKRIEAFRRGEVPEGYTSKWGCMPDSWEYIPMKKLFSKGKKKNEGNEITTVLTNSAAFGVIPQRDYFDKDIANSDNTDGYFVVQPDDYIYNPRISELAPYGPFNKNETGMVGIVSPLYTVLTSKTTKMDPKYLQYFFSSAQWHKYAYSVANYGARFDRMNITDDDFFSLPIVTPPLPEQQKIAEILSTCDKVIELKQKLIEEKRRQKKWLMQKLLNPDKDTIAEKNIGELCTINDEGIEGLTDESVLFYIDISAVNNGSILFPEVAIKLRDAPVRARRTFKRGDILMSTVRPYLHGFALVDFDANGYVASTGFSILRAKEGVSSRLIYQLLFTSEMDKQYSSVLVGSNYPALNTNDIENLTVFIPESYEKQEAVADVLATADRQINLLSLEIEAWQQKKKALMQLLLTGLVRVNA